MVTTSLEEQAAADLLFFMNNAASRTSVKKESAPMYHPIDEYSFMYNVGDDPVIELQILQELFGLQQSDNYHSSTSTGLQMPRQDSSCILSSQPSMVIDSSHHDTRNDATEIPQWSYCIQRKETSNFQVYESQFYLDRTVFLRSNDVDQSQKKPVMQQMRNPHSKQIETDHYHAKDLSSTSYVEPFLSTAPSDGFEKAEQRASLQLDFENYCSINTCHIAQDKKQSSATSEPWKKKEIVTGISTSRQQRWLNMDYGGILVMKEDNYKRLSHSPNVKNPPSIDVKNIESPSYKELLNLKEYFLDQIRYCDTERKQSDMQFIADMKARHSTMEIAYSEMFHDVQHLHDIMQEMNLRLHFESRSLPQLSSQYPSDTELNGLQNDGKIASCSKTSKTISENEVLKQCTSKATTKKRQNKSRRCYFCRKPGHFIEHCAKAAQVMTMPVNQDHVKTHAFYNHKIINEE